MILTNPTDDQLNTAFAERVAGWTYIPSTATKDGRMIGKWMDESGGSVSFVDSPDFCNSADAVLPWLERVDMLHHINLTFDNYWEFTVSRGEKKWVVGVSKSFPKAAVIALLRAHGVEVEFDK